MTRPTVKICRMPSTELMRDQNVCPRCLCACCICPMNTLEKRTRGKNNDGGRNAEKQGDAGGSTCSAKRGTDRETSGKYTGNVCPILPRPEGPVKGAERCSTDAGGRPGTKFTNRNNNGKDLKPILPRDDNGGKNDGGRIKNAARKGTMRRSTRKVSENSQPTESCTCLPGLCTCPGSHNVFKKPVKKKSLCSCFHGETKHFVSPVVSEDEKAVPQHSSDKITPSIPSVPSKDAKAAPDIYLQGTRYICPRYEITVAIIKPNAMHYKHVVLMAIRKSGLDILSERTIHLTPEQVSEIYEKYFGTPILPIYVATTSISPVLVLSLGGIDAVKRWRDMVGPDNAISLEWFFPTWIEREHGSMGDALHASEQVNEAENENRYFFPHSTVEPVLDSKTKIEYFCKKYINPTLRDGLAEVVRNRPRDPILFLAEWLVTHNPFNTSLPTEVLMKNI